jgi:ADP-dependent NAD(P)H-hydrate dehydratase
MTDVLIIDDVELRSEWPLPQPDDDGDKHDRGTIAVIGGAAATPGAVLLAGLAALRVGAGRLSIGTAATNASTLGVAVPEAAVTGLLTTPAGDLGEAALDEARELISAADAVLLGPGMGAPSDTLALVSGLLEHVPTEATIVLDAMALTCGAANRATLGRLADRVIITPNNTEAHHLLGDDATGSDPDMARALSRQLTAVTVLGSVVAAPDGRCWLTKRGNSGLATSGSGDVLAGAIAGLAARGASPLQAALWGLTMHGGAGDRLARRIGPLGFLARELLDELPGVLRADH